MSNYQHQCQCGALPQKTCTCTNANYQSYTITSQKASACQTKTEYPKPIYEPTCCSCSQIPNCCCACATSNATMNTTTNTASCKCPCGTPSPSPKPSPCPPSCTPGVNPCKCPCPPRPTPPKPNPCPCPCPPPCPSPCPPPPCPPKSDAHVGTGGGTLLIGGPSGTIPINTIFSKNGNIICQMNPLKLVGPHTYLVEWSGSVDPLDNPGFVEMQLLLDGSPVAGSGNIVDVGAGTIGSLPISGGAVLTIPAGCHTVELAYKTGSLGAEVSHMNLRIVELY